MWWIFIIDSSFLEYEGPSCKERYAKNPVLFWVEWAVVTILNLALLYFLKYKNGDPLSIIIGLPLCIVSQLYFIINFFFGALPHFLSKKLISTNKSRSRSNLLKKEKENNVRKWLNNL